MYTERRDRQLVWKLFSDAESTTVIATRLRRSWERRVSTIGLAALAEKLQWKNTYDMRRWLAQYTKQLLEMARKRGERVFTRGTWMTDEEISEKIGVAWQEEMDVSSGVYGYYGGIKAKHMTYGKALMICDANRWLKQNKIKLIVHDVRENKTGDFLDWLAELL